jgi:hypothetical protein
MMAITTSNSTKVKPWRDILGRINSPDLIAQPHSKREKITYGKTKSREKLTRTWHSVKKCVRRGKEKKW